MYIDSVDHDRLQTNSWPWRQAWTIWRGSFWRVARLKLVILCFHHTPTRESTIIHICNHCWHRYPMYSICGKTTGGQQCIVDYFWLNQWGSMQHFGVGEGWEALPLPHDKSSTVGSHRRMCNPSNTSQQLREVFNRIDPMRSCNSGTIIGPSVTQIRGATVHGSILCILNNGILRSDIWTPIPAPSTHEPLLPDWSVIRANYELAACRQSIEQFVMDEPRLPSGRDACVWFRLGRRPFFRQWMRQLRRPRPTPTVMPALAFLSRHFVFIFNDFQRLMIIIQKPCILYGVWSQTLALTWD